MLLLVPTRIGLGRDLLMSAAIRRPSLGPGGGRPGELVRAAHPNVAGLKKGSTFLRCALLRRYISVPLRLICG